MRVKNHLVVILAVFIMALGIAFSVKSNLGTSPISSVPYVLSLGLPFSIGFFTILFNAILLLFQIIVLRRDFELIQLLQLPLCVIFGYFIDFHVYILGFLSPSDYIQQLLLLALSCFILAFGVFLTVKSNSLILPGDGLVLAITKVSNWEFGKLKPILDSSMVIAAIIISLILFSSIVGVREGTIISAIVIGFIIQIYNKIIGEKISKLLE